MWCLCRALSCWPASRRYDDVAQSAPVALWSGRITMHLSYRETKTESQQGEKGYSWLFFSAGRPWLVALLVTLLLLALSVAFFVWYLHHSSDLSSDSIAGYAYAISGTICLVLAATLYSVRRRSRRRAVGQLNAALNWHVFLGILGIALLFMHSFGNFNPRTGTYALYGMIALVISGIVGRMFDHFTPRKIAAVVDKALTEQGEDQVETISRRLQSIVVHNTQEIRSFKASDIRGLSIAGIPPTPRPDVEISANGAASLTPAEAGRKAGQVLQAPWDLAYISLEETPQEMDRDAQQYRFIPDRKSALARPGALIPGAREQVDALRSVQLALAREQYLRYIIRFWRILHISLAVLTVGLTLWHIEFALTLLIPTWMGH